MKNSHTPLLRSVFAFLAPLFLLTATACEAGSARSVSPQEASQLLNQGKVFLVDVREADELAESGTAQGALWIPTSKMSEGTPEMATFLSAISPDGKKDKEVILFCRSGARAGRVAPLLQAKGFKVANMGGFSGWSSAGLPVVPKP
jgi:phage shock protein E